METDTKVITVILIVLAVAMAFLFGQIMQNKAASESVHITHTFTKAICDGTNYCQDYVVVCNGNSILGLNAITGAAVQFDSDWQDPRNDQEINGFC